MNFKQLFLVIVIVSFNLCAMQRPKIARKEVAVITTNQSLQLVSAWYSTRAGIAAPAPIPPFGLRYNLMAVPVDASEVVGGIHSSNFVYKIQSMEELLQLMFVTPKECSFGWATEGHFLLDIPVAALEDRITFIIDEDGGIACEDYKPDDGRPNAPLAVYKKLVGHRIYARPACILGLRAGSSEDETKKAYKNKMREWHPDRNKSPISQDAFALITWAAETLGAKEKIDL